MDFLYEHDRKLGEFEDSDVTDMLGQDMIFNTSSMVSPTLFSKLPYVREKWFLSSKLHRDQWSNVWKCNVYVFVCLLWPSIVSGRLVYSQERERKAWKFWGHMAPAWSGTPICLQKAFLTTLATRGLSNSLYSQVPWSMNRAITPVLEHWNKVFRKKTWLIAWHSS